jgi:hypothetical protein
MRPGAPVMAAVLLGCLLPAAPDPEAARRQGDGGRNETVGTRQAVPGGSGRVCPPPANLPPFLEIDGGAGVAQALRLPLQ